MLEKVDFDLIINNLKNEFNIHTDVDLAKKLSLNGNSFSERKGRKSLPYKEIVNLCVSQNISLDKIFTNSQENMGTKNSLADSNTESINLSEYNDEKEIKEVIKLLRFAPKQFLYKLKKRLKDMEKLIDDF